MKHYGIYHSNKLNRIGCVQIKSGFSTFEIENIHEKFNKIISFGSNFFTYIDNLKHDGEKLTVYAVLRNADSTLYDMIKAELNWLLEIPISEVLLKPIPLNDLCDIEKKINFYHKNTTFRTINYKSLEIKFTFKSPIRFEPYIELRKNIPLYLLKNNSLKNNLKTTVDGINNIINFMSNITHNEFKVMSIIIEHFLSKNNVINYNTINDIKTFLNNVDKESFLHYYDAILNCCINEIDTLNNNNDKDQIKICEQLLYYINTHKGSQPRKFRLCGITYEIDNYNQLLIRIGEPFYITITNITCAYFFAKLVHKEKEFINQLLKIKLSLC